MSSGDFAAEAREQVKTSKNSVLLPFFAPTAWSFRFGKYPIHLIFKSNHGENLQGSWDFKSESSFLEVHSEDRLAKPIIILAVKRGRASQKIQLSQKQEIMYGYYSLVLCSKGALLKLRCWFIVSNSHDFHFCPSLSADGNGTTFSTSVIRLLQPNPSSFPIRDSNWSSLGLSSFWRLDLQDSWLQTKPARSASYKNKASLSFP